MWTQNKMKGRYERPSTDRFQFLCRTYSKKWVFFSVHDNNVLLLIDTKALTSTFAAAAEGTVAAPNARNGGRKSPKTRKEAAAVGCRNGAAALEA